MKYKTVLPSKELSHIVRRYWLLESENDEDGKKYRFTPDGFTEMFFQLRSPWCCSYNGESNVFSGRTKLVGQFSYYLDVQIPSKFKNFYIKLYPWACYSLLGIPLYKFTDVHIELSDILHSEISIIHASLLHANTLEEMKRISESWLMKKMRQVTPADPEIQYFAVSLMKNFTNVKIDQLASQYSKSRRTLNEKFKEAVGLNPKHFVKVRRMYSAVSQIKRSNSLRLTDLALDLGFFDQAHFIHEFKRFTGVTPKAYKDSIAPNGKVNNFSIE